MKCILFYEDKHNYGSLTKKEFKSVELARKFMNNEETIPQGEVATYFIVTGHFTTESGAVDKT